jgi:putative aminopeptidase FrvX
MILKTKFKWAAVGAPLGADDGAGIAIMSHMILNNVQGYYVFTQGEERGGLGARFIANTNKELLQQFDRAIAFDRCGNSSVITHQGWDGRSASDEFAIALSNSLNSFGMMYAPDDTGIYTDTAEFVRHIPECTNLSVGYNMEHSEFEVLDIRHFLAMCQAVVGLDWESLPTVRDYKNQYHTSQTFDSSLMDTNNMEWSD